MAPSLSVKVAAATANLSSFSDSILRHVSTSKHVRAHITECEAHPPLQNISDKPNNEGESGDDAGGGNDIAHYLMGIVGMLVCVLGLIANTLSIAVLSRRSMRQTNTNQYLVALAVSDSLVLLFTVLTNLKDTRLSNKNELQSVTWADAPFVPLSYPYVHALCVTFQVSAAQLREHVLQGLRRHLVTRALRRFNGRYGISICLRQISASARNND